MMKKRVLSLFLVFAMVFSLSGMTVQAAKKKVKTTKITVKKGNSKKVTIKKAKKAKAKKIKWTIKNKNTTNNKTTITKVNLTSLKVENDRTLQLSLSSAYALSINDISVKAKVSKSGSYRRTVEVTGLETKDKKNYTVQLWGNEGLYANDYVQVSISKLSGTKTLESQYKEKVTAYTGETTYTSEVGNSVSQDFYFYSGAGYWSSSRSGEFTVYIEKQA